MKYNIYVVVVLIVLLCLFCLLSSGVFKKRALLNKLGRLNSSAYQPDSEGANYPIRIICWAFREVALQDVGFDNNQYGLQPLTHVSFRCEVPTPSVFERRLTITLEPHILKHHIPELTNL